jgi:sulfur carrier protein ThiS
VKVRVRAYGGLAYYLSDKKGEVELDIQEGLTLEGLVKKLGIPDEEIWLISVNNEIKPREAALEGGEEILIFAPVAGGLTD